MSLLSTVVPSSRPPSASLLGASNAMVSRSLQAPEGRTLTLTLPWWELLVHLERVALAEADALIREFRSWASGRWYREYMAWFDRASGWET